MRITAELFAAQLVRRVFADGGFAAVARRGNAAAGALFVVRRGRNSSVELFAPAPQALVGEDAERRFMRDETVGDDAAVDARTAREARFDPDFWLIEIETDAPAERYLTLADDA